MVDVKTTTFHRDDGTEEVVPVGCLTLDQIFRNNPEYWKAKATKQVTHWLMDDQVVHYFELDTDLGEYGWFSQGAYTVNYNYGTLDNPDYHWSEPKLVKDYFSLGLK